MLGTVALGLSQVAARHQVLMHTHSPLVLASPTKQITQGKMQLGRVRVVLHSFDESINRLVLLLIQQKIQALEVRLGCLAIFNAQLPQIQARCQPPQGEDDRKPEQNPSEIKFHVA